MDILLNILIGTGLIAGLAGTAAVIILKKYMPFVIKSVNVYANKGLSKLQKFDDNYIDKLNPVSKKQVEKELVLLIETIKQIADKAEKIIKDVKI